MPFSVFDFLKSVRDDARLDRAAKDVAWVLATYADKNGACFPSVKTIMSGAGISAKNTVLNGTRRLVECGYVTVEKRRENGVNGSNRYVLQGSSTIEQGGSVIELGGSTIELGWVNDCTRVVQPLNEGSSTIEPKHTNEQTNEQTNEHKSAARGTRLTLEQLPPEWKSWTTEKYPGLDAAAAFEEFKDYWAGISGKQGVKLDWFATWRNSIRSMPDWKRKRLTKQKQTYGMDTDWSKIDYREGIGPNGEILI